MKRVFILMLVAGILGLAVGCQPDQPGSPVTPWSESPLSVATEIVESASFSPLTTPSTSLVWPTPAEGTAMVGGIILHVQPDGSLEPMKNVWLGLARLVKADDGETEVARFSEKESPKTMAGANGEFVFADVPPDTYNLVVVMANSPYFMRDYKTGESIVFAVKAGDTFDLGEVRFASPR